MMGESSEVSLLTPRYNGTIAATATIHVGSGVLCIGGMDCGIGGSVVGRGHRLPFRNRNPQLLLFPGNEDLLASAGPSLLVQALSAVCGDQGHLPTVR